MPLGEAVRRLRKGRGWTQVQYAQAIVAATNEQTTQGFITNVEKGRHENPSERIMYMLAAGLGVSIAELRHEAGFDSIDQLYAEGLDSEFLREMALIEDQLTPEVRRALVETARALARQDAQKQEEGLQRAPLHT